MKFQVWIVCRDNCEDLEPARKLLLVEDPLSAIVHASTYRDQLHETWIETVE